MTKPIHSTAASTAKAAGLILLAACALCGVLLASCAKADQGEQPSQPAEQASEPVGEVTFTDDAGNTVTVNDPQRVVACMGSFADAWTLAGGTLVGASDDAFADYGVSEDGVQRVGDFSAPSLESIIACEPDFVIMTSASSGKPGSGSQLDLKEGLDAAGIPVAYFEVVTFDDYLHMLRTFCDITGRDDLYHDNGEVPAAAIEQVKSEMSVADKAPSVALLMTYSQGVRVQSSSTMVGSMLADLGARNVADEHRSLLKDFSVESLIETDPDYVFVVPMGNDSEASLRALKEATEANPAWAQLSAVQNGRYTVLDDPMFTYKPNERWGEAYRLLGEALQK